VAPGDEVAKGAALFDIETDKAAMEVESPASGRLHAVTAQPGDRIAVGTVVALIFAEGEDVVEVAAPATTLPEPIDAPRAAPPAAVARLQPAAPDSASPEADGLLRATPAARAAARQAGVTLAEVPGTGPQGRIQRDDVTAHVEGQSGPPPAAAGPTLWSAQPGPLHISHRKGRGVPLVLLHGLTADSQSWAPLEKALGPDRPLIRIDLPGHGRSPRRRLRSFAELARMLVEAFDEATRAHDQVHLLGHSLGGALALAIADTRARKIASLSLMAPAGLGPEVDAAALTGIIRASRAESLAPWLRRLTATPEGISDDYARAAMKQRADPGLRAAQADMAEVLFPDGVQPFDLRPALSRVECPTALIWGRSDHILPYRHALAAGGDFAIHLLSGAGHIPQVETPDRVARIVTRHLAGISSGR
jgi:pyruvate dehydrogenase E2 component (dihydrolipoamide acetyltransferase)